MMPDDLDSIGLLGFAMAVLKDKLGRLTARFEGDRVRDVPVVIARERDNLAPRLEPPEKFGRRDSGSLIVHQISNND